MNATQTNTVGGVCELLGIAAVVWGLVDLACYRGVPARFRAWLEARRAAIVAEVRRVLHRPRQVTLVDAGTATMRMTVNQAVVLTRERFTPRPGQSLEDQIAELGASVNRLQEDLLAQDQRHRDAVETLQREMDRKLQAEREHAEADLNVVRRDLVVRAGSSSGSIRRRLAGCVAPGRVPGGR